MVFLLCCLRSDIDFSSGFGVFVWVFLVKRKVIIFFFFLFGSGRLVVLLPFFRGPVFNFLWRIHGGIFFLSTSCSFKVYVLVTRVFRFLAVDRWWLNSYEPKQIRREAWSGQDERCVKVLILLRGGVVVKEKEIASLPLNEVLDQAFLSLIQRKHEVWCGDRVPNKFIYSHLQLNNLAIEVSDRENGFLHVGILRSSGFHDSGSGFGEVLLFQAAIVDQSPIDYFGVTGEKRGLFFHQVPKT